MLDAVGGALVVAAGFGLTYVLSGPRKLETGEKGAAPSVKSPPAEPAVDPEPDPQPDPGPVPAGKQQAAHSG